MEKIFMLYMVIVLNVIIIYIIKFRTISCDNVII